MEDLSNLRTQIEAQLKVMGYYPSSFKITSVKAELQNIKFVGYFHEYLGTDHKFEGLYDTISKGWISFSVEEN